MSPFPNFNEIKVHGMLNLVFRYISTLNVLQMDGIVPEILKL